ncbi:MAG: UDP-N-acetylglucosamine 2-epimerase (non-hydrolyzing) [Thermoplasmata archaeon]|nr:UDP-N-acetylglucosamine 2-epimerase (non-hydrolyzing) [Thermoplasmata archaeon]
MIRTLKTKPQDNDKRRLLESFFPCSSAPLLKVINIVGARPQFIKLAPVLKAIQHYNEEHKDLPIHEVLVHTGQHYDYEMSQVFFDELGLKNPDYHLGVGSGTHAEQTAEMLKRIEQVLMKEKPDIVMVYGDTNSTLAGALAAAKLHIPVAHVEAGLRSFNRRMPEEINRVLTDHISDFLFCPTQTAVNNLKQEGITKGVYLVGDVMYDAVLMYGELAERKSTILKTLNLKPKSYALATVHRAENTDDPERLSAIFKAFKEIAENGLSVVVPLHPRTRNALSSLEPNPLSYIPAFLRLIDPVSYLDMLVLEKNAKVILTDSGGVQKEAFFFKVPCVTLREETEWVETVESGWNTICGGSNVKQITQAAVNAQPGIRNSFFYGNGDSAKKIVTILASRSCQI